jgi:hypothetical protein
LPHRGGQRDGCRRGDAFVRPMPSLRACGARPSGGVSPGEMALRGQPEIMRRTIFSEGRGLRARVAGPYQRQGIAFSPDDDARGRMAYRAHARVKPRRSHAGARGPPLRGDGRSAGMDAPRRDGLAGKGRRYREGWFSRRGAVSAPGWQGRRRANVFHPNRMGQR